MSAPFEIRGWDIERFDPVYVFDMIKRAHEAGMNTISLSHEIVMNAEEILWDWHRYQHLQRFCSACHELDMKVYLWNHQIVNPPEQYIVYVDGKPKKLNLDEPGLWEWLTDRYKRVVKRVPNLDGIILSLTESQFQVHRDDVAVTKMPQHERMASVINAVYEGLKPSDKQLIIRDFLRSPQEMESFTKALKLVPDDVWVFTKCVPNDWEFCYPPHPLLGKVTPHKQIMELDLATEVGGNSRVPFAVPEYNQKQLRLARDKGLAGAIGRCDDGYKSNRGLPDEINVYAYSLLLHNPNYDCNKIWRDWCTQRYGESGATVAEKILRRSFDMVTKNSYTLGFWTGRGGPSIRYTDEHLIENSSALWSDDPIYKKTDKFLKESGLETISAAVNEKRESEELADLSIADLDASQASLKPEDYQMLREYFARSKNNAIVGRLWARAYFALRWYRNTEKPEAKVEMEYALLDCKEFIESIKDKPDASALDLPSFVKEFEEYMSKR